ncbi:DUF397 domain-containing protein [Streptomyces sp. DT20]|uniref:DUF397 domain-containing protein n=1 Tax=unclassified Streptomyces TaxID=2593676 RepID=UPI000939C8EA|nr:MULTISPECIES: DUF397 domain-containing protein [unclassified Streptomyces]OKK14356.1 hypothetical protein AMK09_27250 [Streptomyces sp. CB02488]WRZ14915.1 DUF397 domain-containing protein [Streptomyces sp. NBC_00341]
MARQIRPEFFKSSYSANANGECVECAERRYAFLVRDSKTADGAVLSFTHPAWREFTASLRGDGTEPR